MLQIDGVVGLLLLGLWLFAIFDVIATDASLCRNLPKGVWLILVILLPDVGSVAWLALGRPRTTTAPHTTPPPHWRRPVGVEDSNDYVSRSEELNRRLEAWEEEQRRRNEGSG